MMPVSAGQRFTVEPRRADEIKEGDVLLEGNTLWCVANAVQEEVPSVSFNLQTGEAVSETINVVLITTTTDEHTPSFMPPGELLLTIIPSEGTHFPDSLESVS